MIQTKKRQNWKIYKDYLIVPIIFMFLISKSAMMKSDEQKQEDKIKQMSQINAVDICWGNLNTNNYGDVWYLENEYGANKIVVNPAEQVIEYVVNNRPITLNYQYEGKHLKAKNEYKTIDLIFPNALTTYDCVSEQYFMRGDYDHLLKNIVDSKFINTNNEKEYYEFNEDGNGLHRNGIKRYKFTWEIQTQNTILIKEHSNAGSYIISIEKSGGNNYTDIVRTDGERFTQR